MNMKNKFFPFFIIAIFIFVFIIFYKGLQDTNIYTPAVKNNNEIPAFSAKLFYSNETVNSFEIFEPNKYYLLNIWSSWCVPCRQEHSLLMDLAKDRNINMLGLNYKDTKINAKKFLEEHGNPYEKIIFDNNGVKAIEWGAFGVPESFLIYNNKVLEKYVGPLNQDIVKKIKLLIK
jgi:cytochrome c biogenesis protein CcmG, thiol:disulfide interchange protein DsbE